MATKKLDNFYCDCPMQVKRVFQVLQSLGGKALKKVILPVITFPALFCRRPNLCQHPAKSRSHDHSNLL
jgi:hypothetical protein